MKPPSEFSISDRARQDPKAALNEGAAWCKENPKAATAAGVGAIVIGSQIGVAAVVNAVGFTPTGVQAGNTLPSECLLHCL